MAQWPIYISIMKNPKTLQELEDEFELSEEGVRNSVKRLEKKGVIWYNQTDDKYEIAVNVVKDL